MTLEQIQAPFSIEQVEALNHYQRAGVFHPFTCPGDYACTDRVLVATHDGWVCACGKYTQDWAHAFMAAVTS